MNKDNKITKTVFMYARKSSESEERQVQSIDDQIDSLKKYAVSRGLTIKKIFKEAKSAKKPNNRSEFDEMIKRIKKDEVRAILCWQFNRLSRNPVDTGTLQWMLQTGELEVIYSTDRELRREDSALLMSLEGGIANQYILDLSKNTKRGLESKLQKGWQNGIAPIGYLNHGGKDEVKTIIKDPHRFDLVRQMWDLMLTGNYTPPQILKIATEKWSFRTRKFKKIGGGPMSRSAIYKLFTSLFYAGIIEVNGNQYPGRHDKMITLEEYDHVQAILGRKGKPRPKTHRFAFTGMLRCDVCGCLYTAETKYKLIKKTGELKPYTYYHCTRKTLKVKCDQKKCIREDNLNLLIEKEIEKYAILPQFLEWALEEISEQSEKEIAQRSQMYETQQKGLVETQKEIDNLIMMRSRELIDDEEFARSKEPLEVHLARLKEKRDTTEQRAGKFLELSEKVFSFSTYARKAFIMAKGEAGLELKKDILRGLGEVAKIKDGTLHIEPMEWLIPIKNEYSPLEAEYKRLEPEKTRTNTAQTDAFTSVRTHWLRG